MNSLRVEDRTTEYSNQRQATGFVAVVDGVERYRTDLEGCGAWKFRHGDGDGYERSSDATGNVLRANESWHQFVGTVTRYSHRSFRAAVLEWLEDDEMAAAGR